LKVVKRSALRKARSVPLFDTRRNSLTTNHEGPPTQEPLEPVFRFLFDL